MIKAIIVDDEDQSRKNIAVLLEDFCDGVEVVALAKSVKEAIEAINEFRPDVVFLDLQMQGETGIDLLNAIKKINFEVVFATAHAEYALNPIRLAAIEYILKPIDIGDLKQAIAKIAGKKRDEVEIMNQINALLHNTKVNNPEEYILSIPSDKMYFTPLKNVLYFEGNSSVTRIFLNNGSIHQVFKSLKEYDNLLSQYHFFRTDQSFLININEIKHFNNSDSANIVMNNDVHIPISERKRNAFLKLIKGINL